LFACRMGNGPPAFPSSPRCDRRIGAAPLKGIVTAYLAAWVTRRGNFFGMRTRARVARGAMGAAELGTIGLGWCALIASAIDPRFFCAGAESAIRLR
jgi:hypothetical protein